MHGTSATPTELIQLTKMTVPYVAAPNLPGIRVGNSDRLDARHGSWTMFPDFYIKNFVGQADLILEAPIPEQH